MQPLGISILGCGTVGSGVIQLLLTQSQRLTRRCGRTLALRHVVVRSVAKARETWIPRDRLTDRVETALDDPDTHVVVELIGGTDLALDLVLAALKAGKHVVTANKALLAAHGARIFDAAREANRVVAFEGSVAGGIPIVAAMSQSLAANQITAIQGILNGTSNFILSSMADGGKTYTEALAEAQRLGYAEADPTLDVDGSDAAHKLAILSQIAFGVTIAPDRIEKHGIADVHVMDLRFAAELGYTIKLLAEAWLDGEGVALHVAPVLLRRTDMLAQVRGACNAVQVIGDAVGETVFQGPGAGMMPTASAVMADILDIAIGRAELTFKAARLWSSENTIVRTLKPAADVPSRFYLRVLVEDRAGMLASVTRLLADRGISISSVIQHEALEDMPDTLIPLVIITHYAPTGRFRESIAEISGLPGVASPGVWYSVDD